jgi:RNA polymerase sigma factor (sigma-70 family)
LEASALTHASRRGLLARRSPLLKLQGDAKLIAMARGGNPAAFEMIVDRYQGRLLGFCRQMLGSTEDAEDVLQEVFVNAYKAMLADEREINLRPWLYRIARNRCLNHLRKPTADAQESMDMVPEVEAASTAEKVHNREEFRQLLVDVKKLPETQRAALLLREMDALSYEEIATAMDTTVPSVKSLLVRARISLAEASQARLLTCGEVRLELSEAAEGLRKVSGPIRRHVRECDECADFRSQVRSNEKALAALAPIGPLVALKGLILSKLGLGGGAGASAGGAGASTAAAGAGAAGAAGAVSGVGAALGGGGAAGGIGALGGAIGTKAVAGVVTAAVLTAGAVDLKQSNSGPVDPISTPRVSTQLHTATPPAIAQIEVSKAAVAPITEEAAPPPTEVAVEETPPVEPSQADVAVPPPAEPALEDAAGQSVVDASGGVPATAPTTSVTGATASTPTAGAHGGGGTVVVTVTSPGTTPTTAPPATPPVETSPPVEEPVVTPPPEETPPPETSAPPVGNGAPSEPVEPAAEAGPAA